jgi:SAM-dependent methyltransferase
MPDPAITDGCAACGAATIRERFAGHDRLHGRGGDATIEVCAACGSGTTEPRLAPEALAAFYPDDYGPYAEPRGVAAVISRVIRAVQSRLALRRFPLSTAAERAPGRGLDVGCGRGDLAGRLVDEGWRMTGVEPSANACAAAATRGVDARCGTLDTVALEPGAYDLIVFQHSLEHTGDPLADLERARDALAEGGVVIVTVPNFGSWQARRFRDRWYHLDLPRHRTHFDAQGLRALHERAGLRVQRLATSTSSVGLPATIQYALAGRCLFPGGMGLRIASGLCVLSVPLARLANRIGGGGDQLHVVATAGRPA